MPAVARPRRPLLAPLLLLVALTSGVAAAEAGAGAAEALERGQAAAARGDFGAAADHFRRAVAALEAGDDAAALQGALVQLAQAQQAQGDYAAALASLERAQRLASARGDPAAEATLRGVRGSLYVALASPEQARQELEAALALARQAQAPGVAAVVLNNLGNAHVAASDYAAARSAFEEAAREAQGAGDATLAVRAHANAARACLELGDAAGARANLARAEAALAEQPPDHDRAMLLVHLGISYQRLHALERGAPSADAASDLARAHALLVEAEEVAAARGDARAASYAQGHLAQLYAEEGRDEEALELTRRAIFQAQQAEAPEVRFRWHAQAGEIHARRNEREAALAEYSRSITLLEELRHTLATGYARPPASFREIVQPIYFAYVDLLLRRAADAPEPEADLQHAQQTLESLKAAELRDYFRDECVDTALASRVQASEVSSAAAVVYPIFLDDRIELLTSIGGRITRQAVPVGRARVTEEIRRFRSLLEKRTTRQFLRPAAQLHAWLVEPLEARLEAAEVVTLVFVPDGPLRTVPLAALHDGERFLVERYATAVTPGLQLTDPRPLQREGLELFAGGLSEAVHGFAPLPFVREELRQVREVWGGTLLLDESFVRERVESTLASERFSVVHLATHASFGGRGDEGFILTHDGRISLDQLAAYVGLFRFRDQPLDLLVLSACTTAAGDDRAALGLSGVAVKAGARSALGSLWAVNDEATSALIERFYTALREPGRSRAEALRMAQREQLADRRFRHPAYWAAFVLISNWL